MPTARGDAMSKDPDIIWMTYDDAARVLRIKPDSVRRRAAARKWPKQLGNDKLARVGIPRDIIPDTTHEITPDTTPDNPDESGKIRMELQEALAKIGALESDLKAARISISALETRLEETQGDRDAWKDQAKELTKTQAELIGRVADLSHPKPGLFRRIFRR
jgi:hypothetical protein